jgi:hypothetical protein
MQEINEDKTRYRRCNSRQTCLFGHGLPFSLSFQFSIALLIYYANKLRFHCNHQLFKIIKLKACQAPGPQEQTLKHSKLQSYRDESNLRSNLIFT